MKLHSNFQTVKDDYLEAYRNNWDAEALLNTHISLSTVNDAEALQIRNAAKNPPKVTKRLWEPSTITTKGIRTLPPKVFVCKRLKIAKGDLAIVCAAGGSGKSMFLQYLSLCASKGLPLFGSFPITQGRVLHIDQEQGQILTQRRYERLAEGLGLDHQTLDIDYARIEERMDREPNKMQAMEDAFVEMISGYHFVIIDSLKKISCADENSDQIEVILNMLKHAAERSGSAIVLIHHKGKGNGSAKQTGRGHSSIYDSVDLQLDLDAANGVYEISCAKIRDGNQFDGFKYSMADSGDFITEQDCSEALEFQLLQESVKNRVVSARVAILESLSSQGELNQRSLYTAVKGERSKFIQAIDGLLIDECIAETAGPKRSRVFAVTEKGKMEFGWTGGAK
jgi:predicted transcriptional regulator